MATNDTTIFQEPTKAGKRKNVQSNIDWKPVSIGGVTGIMLGAGSMYAVNSYANTNSVQSDLHTASGERVDQAEDTGGNEPLTAEVDQNLSFGEAFASARAQMGPGGVFEWHGNLYNTYTSEEWYQMTKDERDQFGEDVAGHYTRGGHHEETATSISNPPKEDVAVVHGEEVETHYLGMDKIVDDDGNEHVIGLMTVGGRRTVLIDTEDDPDGEFELAAVDVSGNGQFENDEVIDISGRGITLEEFAGRVMDEQEQHSTDEDSDLAVLTDDMPDYMDDVNNPI